MRSGRPGCVVLSNCYRAAVAQGELIWGLRRASKAQCRRRDAADHRLAAGYLVDALEHGYRVPDSSRIEAEPSDGLASKPPIGPKDIFPEY